MLFPFLSRLFAPMFVSRTSSADDRRARCHRRPPPKPRTARPAVEALEDRTLPAANFGWAAAFGSDGVIARTIATDSSNNVIVGGQLYQAPVTFGSGANAVTLTPVSPYQGFLAKYTSTGNLLWAELANRGWDGAIDSAGNLLQAEQDATTNDFRLSKYDPNGNTLWTLDLTQAGIAGTYPRLRVALDSSGNAYVTGPPPNDVYTTFVAKFLGSNGSLAWNVRHVVGVNGFLDIAVDPSGNVWTTGSYIGKQDFDPGPGTYYLTSLSAGKSKNNYVVNAYVLELNGNGGFVWAGSMGTDADPTVSDYGAAGRGVAVDASGNVYLAGAFHLGTSKNNFNPTGSSTVALTNTDSNGNGTYVVKLNASRKFQWAESYGAFALSDSPSIAVDASGAVYLTARFSGTVDFDPGAGQQLVTASGNDLYVLKLDTTGSFNWVADIRADPSAGSNGVLPHGLAVDSLGDVYVGGAFTGTYDFDPGLGTYSLTGSNSPGGSGFVLQLTQSNP